MRRKPGWLFPALALVPLLFHNACSSSSDTTIALDSASVQQKLLGHDMVLPSGFSIGVFAQGLKGVRFMIQGPDGAIYASRVDGTRIVRMTDNNHDGTAEGITTIHDGLDGPHGMAFRGDVLYVAERSRVVRFATPTSAAEAVITNLPADGGHDTRTIVFRGDTLYVSVGSSCNICDESNSLRAAVTAFTPDGANPQTYSHGLRNSVGLAVNPDTKEIWATNNDRDNLGDEIPPDRVNILQKGGFFGWPNCYLPGKPNPEYSSDPGPCGSVIAPAVQLQAHAAPLGLAFYTGSAFPAQYQGALFIAEHGSWNRSAKVGYQVEWVPVQDGKPAGSPRRFVSGWLEGQDNWGRPVDVLPLSGGSLLISDDQGGRIYRVSYTG